MQYHVDDDLVHNYLNGILARLELRGERDESEGVPDEAIVLDGDRNLAEGATSNLFFVRDGDERECYENAEKPASDTDE